MEIGFVRVGVRLCVVEREKAQRDHIEHDNQRIRMREMTSFLKITCAQQLTWELCNPCLGLLVRKSLKDVGLMPTLITLQAHWARLFFAFV